jgi:hypothetical protein
VSFFVVSTALPPSAVHSPKLDLFGEFVAAFLKAIPPSVDRTTNLSAVLTAAGQFVTELEERADTARWRPRMSPLTTEGPESWRRAAWIIADLTQQWEAFENTVEHRSARSLISQATDQLRALLSRTLVGISTIRSSAPPAGSGDETVLERAQVLAGWAVGEFFLNEAGTGSAWRQIGSTVDLDIPAMLTAAETAFDNRRSEAGLQILRQVCESALLVLADQDVSANIRNALIGPLNVVNTISHFHTPVQLADWFRVDGGDLRQDDWGSSGIIVLPAATRLEPSPLDPLYDAHRKTLSVRPQPIVDVASFARTAKSVLNELFRAHCFKEISFSPRPITSDQLTGPLSDGDPFVQFAAMVLDVGQKWRIKLERDSSLQKDLREPLGQLGSILTAWGHRELGDIGAALDCLNQTVFISANPEKQLWELVIEAVTHESVLQTVVSVGRLPPAELLEWREKILDAQAKNLIGRKNFGMAIGHVRSAILGFLKKLDELSAAAGTTEAVAEEFYTARALFLSVSVLAESCGNGACRATDPAPPASEPFLLRAPKP